MPNYLHRCSKCGNEQNDLRGMTDPAPVVKCSECNLDMPQVMKASFQFTYGKENFHGPTIGERATHQIETARAAGLDPVPVGHKTYTGR